MRIPAGLLTIADFKDALECESFATRGLIPEDTEMWALFNHPGADEWAYRRCVGEFAPVPGQVVTVRKAGHGVRPVAELSIRDRVLYRALVRRWKTVLPEPDRSSEAYDAFLKAPLGTSIAPTYVVSSDVAACYEYVDHGLLIREVLARTGDSAGVEALTSLLAGIMGRSYGLPQQSGSSDVLAEAYLSVVERRLLRQGLKVWRYNDDFRIASNTWSDALNAVDALERECRAIGLVLNDLKTVIRKGTTYKRTLGRRAEVLKEISDEVEVDLTDVTPGLYDESVLVPEKSAVAVLAAHSVVNEWLVLQEKALAPDAKSSLTKDESDKRLALTDLLRWALSVLQTEETDFDVLGVCGQILRTEQTLTPLVARYLAKASDAVVTIAWFEAFLGGSPYLTPWQAWWVAPSLRSVNGSYADGSLQRSWLESVWKSSACPEPVRAGIAFTVAQKGLEDAKGLMGLYESMTETGRPFVAHAVGAIASPSDSGATTLLDEDTWVKWAFESGQSGV